MLNPGINGFLRWDTNGDGDLTGDNIGLAGWTVRLVDDNGQVLQLTDGVEPDDFAQNTILNTVNPNVTLSAIGSGVDNNQVIVRDGDPASTGAKVFRHYLVNGAGVSNTWSSTSRKLKIEFTSPVTTVSLDAISNSSTDYGRLEIYDAAGNLLDRYTTRGLADGNIETMTLSRATPEIAYAIARGHAGTAIQFDNLQFGPQAVTVTDSQGAYSLSYLSAGTYNVELVSPLGATVTTPSSQQIVLIAGAAIGNVDFGAESSFTPWQNSTNRADVDGNGEFDIIDVLSLIDYYRLHGAHDVLLSTPPPIFADVDGNNRIDVIDIFTLIDIFRGVASGSGEGESTSDSGTSTAEGEFTGSGSDPFFAQVLASLSTDVLPGAAAADTILTSSSVTQPNSTAGEP
ncbi:MAG: hypothetical protein IID46_14605, partial [Planctomycetes bacterium]|nr:hypothetical protein [Planctomycetota bacterium]